MVLEQKAEKKKFADDKKHLSSLLEQEKRRTFYLHNAACWSDLTESTWQEGIEYVRQPGMGMTSRRVIYPLHIRRK